MHIVHQVGKMPEMVPCLPGDASDCTEVSKLWEKEFPPLMRKQ
jgi:hypothetical protein